jgi:hypothetical protein
LFLYGAVAFSRPPGWAIDFDFHALLTRPLTDRERAEIRALYARLAADTDLGGDLDGYFVLVDDARRAQPPVHQLDPTISDGAWALHRAHVYAGRYVLIAGADPRTIIPAPSWQELDAALRAELEFVDEHPEPAAYGILNGARILWSFRTRDVVRSKYQAGRWALDSLPDEWHDAVRAALRRYSGTATDADEATLVAAWAPFVAYVKASIPA